MQTKTCVLDLSVNWLRQSITAQATIGNNMTGPAALSKRRSRITIRGMALILLEEWVLNLNTPDSRMDLRLPLLMLYSHLVKDSIVQCTPCFGVL